MSMTAMETLQPKHDPRPRYHAVARRLSLLSPELVHKIFDDLPIGRILELACLPDASYTEQCAISHYGISKIFDKDQFIEVRTYFAVYAKLCRDRQGRKHSGYPDLNPKSSPVLQRDTAFYLAYFKRPTAAYTYILSDIKTKINELLEGYHAYLPVLVSFDDNYRIPDEESWKYLLSADDTKRLWESLHTAEAALNRTKSQQILRICGLLEQYPGMLRKMQNCSQDTGPNGELHLIQALQRTAKEMLKPQIVRQRFVGTEVFATHRFPVIPYDRHLRCFLKVIRKYAPGDDKIYPHDIQKDLKTVIDGMAFVYIRGSYQLPKPQLLRTKFTPYCAKGLKAALGQNQPQFVVGINPPVPKKERAKVIDEGEDWRIYGHCRIMPLEEKEFEWVEAFLRCCKYMEGIQDAEWTAGITIGDFWKKHTSIGFHATSIRNQKTTPIT